MILISDRLGKMGVGQKTVLAVKSVSAGSEAWSEDKFLPGDVIEQLRTGSQVVAAVKSPFSGGKTGFGRELRKLASAKERIYVRISRQGRRLEITASVVAEESVLRKHYALADYEDKSYTATFMDATEEECALIQDQTQKVLEGRGKSRTSNTQMRGCVISYAWQQKMQHFLPPPNSSIVFSLLVMPFKQAQLGAGYNDVDDTSARAMAWLSASQKVGVPIIFVNIQTEPILRQGSSARGFGVAGQEEASSVANSGSYTVHDEAGSDIGVLRGVRLWFAPAASELALNLVPHESERLGVGISHTEEGFLYVSSVEFGTAADRAGLKQLHDSGRAAGKLLVISRITGRKVAPWMVQSSGAIRCFDTLLISEILSLHKQSLEPIQMFVMLWNGVALLPRGADGVESALSSSDFSSDSLRVSRTRTSSSSSRVVKWQDSGDSGNHCSVRYENEDFSFSL
ncbi:uncharacterized protein LOC9633085 isoform X2 [Selaginella moellendorffii]|uniref:uncharacterized protein LOC9633085 isoform X2 n=1 Tax=Selaginella moellendorffii TaxID=88036 RepID=UPI000D1C7763|nr:uncharacterized protein LOC9633085 isoform X2 [Selaginella moellendorffii]XP_024528288.1 uncharacterized protein LOC9633085 isoform X2 [Selaginella moellendorffii]|eukprot:XP_024528287.1 uncharacterized protein LOC9633085 isoform X2 [Selaginella moellendorffii]